jgi:hypothetical protein
MFPRREASSLFPARRFVGRFSYMLDVKSPIALIDNQKGETKAQACANAFHEKAGRSQVGSFIFSLDKLFSPAELPLSPPFHPHSQ